MAKEKSNTTPPRVFKGWGYTLTMRGENWGIITFHGRDVGAINLSTRPKKWNVFPFDSDVNLTERFKTIEEAFGAFLVYKGKKKIT